MCEFESMSLSAQTINHSHSSEFPSLFIWVAVIDPLSNRRQSIKFLFAKLTLWRSCKFDQQSFGISPM